MTNKFGHIHYISSPIQALFIHQYIITYEKQIGEFFLSFFTSLLEKFEELWESQHQINFSKIQNQNCYQTQLKMLIISAKPYTSIFPNHWYNLYPPARIQPLHFIAKRPCLTTDALQQNGKHPSLFTIVYLSKINAILNLLFHSPRQQPPQP